MRRQIVTLDDDEDEGGYSRPMSRPGRVVAVSSEDEEEDYIPVKHAPARPAQRGWGMSDSPQYDEDIEVASIVDVEMESRRAPVPSGVPQEPLPSFTEAIKQFKERTQAKKEELAARDEQAEAERREMGRLRHELDALKGELEAARQRVRTLETAAYEREKSLG